MGELQRQVRDEVERFHAFLVGWFTGALSLDAFERDFLDHFAADFTLVPPAGSLSSLEDLAVGLRRGHGSNPAFRIAIRNIELRHHSADLVLATYEEWQRNARASRPPDNARRATVLFRRGADLQWLHVHETWLPAEVMQAGPFDF